jgi:uncharacterized membrane protein
VKRSLATRLKKACHWALVISLCLGYPVVAHFSAASPTPSLQGALVAITPLAGLAFLMAWRSPRRPVMLALWAAALAALYIASDWLIGHYHWVFLIEHAGTYSLLCLAFGRTLSSGETPMVSRFARIVHGDLSPALMRYTRRATWAWSVYFGLIAGLSVLLFLSAPMRVWSAFANLLGIPLLLLMFSAEYAVRCYVLPAAERAGPLEAIRAYRKASAGSPARAP